jgi:membrane dipeptidase
MGDQIPGRSSHSHQAVVSMIERIRPLAMALSLLLVVGCATAPAQSGPVPDDPHLAVAHRVLSTTPLIDGHNDLPWVIRTYEGGPGDVLAYDLRSRTPGHTDIPRMREGMVGGTFWSVWIPTQVSGPGASRVQLEQIDIARRMIDAYPEAFELALTAEDAVRAFEAGRIASMIGMEGGHAIENSLGALRTFYDLGARYMTLTHSANIDWADSCCEAPEHDGLTAFGREVVREMNRLGMLVDLSHVAPKTMHDALDVTEAPVIFSHSSAYAVTPHPRNVPDDVLVRMAENGGVVMVTFVTVFVNQELMEYRSLPPAERVGPAPVASMEDVIAHIEHVRDVAGIDHVGIGSDFDGATMPEGLEDVSTLPALLAELSRRGWSESDLRKLAGENVLRAWRGAERVAARLRSERGPSVATIAELDGVIPGGDGAFVTRLGRDTLVVERFRYGPSTFEADVVLRSPRTVLTRYRADLDRLGHIETLTATSFDPSGAEPVRVARTRYLFRGDSVHVTVERGGDWSEFAVPAEPGAIPFIDMVHWPFELAFTRLDPDAGGAEVPMLAGRGVQTFTLARQQTDHATIRHPLRGVTGAQVDALGRILAVDAAGTTRALTVERVADVDVEGLARAFAARDARGESFGALSGRAEAEGVIDGARVVVDHGVPSRRGREIFGGLVPYGEVWRTGANRATHLSTDRDLLVGATRVPAGTYTLFTVPGPAAWTLIVNRRTDITGTAYDAGADLARIPMETRSLADPVEDFTIVVDPAGYLRMRWDRTEAMVRVRPAP